MPSDLHVADVVDKAGVEFGRLAQSPVVRSSTGEPGDVLRGLHRALTLVAVMGLAVGMRSFWNLYALSRPGLAIVLTLAYLVMLVAAIVTLCASSSRALMRVDVTVLVTAIVIKVVASWGWVVGERPISVDEGIFLDRAARALAAGHNPYIVDGKNVLGDVAPTQLMDGGTVAGFSYPPFGAELSAVVQWMFPSLVGVVVVAWLALFATAIFLFRVAPASLRPVVTLGVLGLGTLTVYADRAYPSLMALPLLCVAVWGWPSIGRGGGLGRAGVMRAVALGLGCATHQLGWFLAVFLLAGLLLLRLGDLPARTAVAVTVRYTGVAVGAFLLVNVPFVVSSPMAWLTGMFEPLLQHAVPHGQGIAGLSYYLIGGSGALGLYGHASVLLLLAVLILYAVHLRVLGRAAVVLPWLLFWVSTRSQDGYWVLTMPLWVAALVGTRRDDFAHAYRLRLPSRFTRVPVVPAWARAAISAALFLPALICLGVAVVTRQPLTMHVTSALAAGKPVAALTVAVVNRSDDDLEPHFAVTTDLDITEFWTVVDGPRSISAGTAATYTLAPRKSGWKLPATGPVFLRVVSDQPQTLSTRRLAG